MGLTRKFTIRRLDSSTTIVSIVNDPDISTYVLLQKLKNVNSMGHGIWDMGYCQQTRKTDLIKILEPQCLAIVSKNSFVDNLQLILELTR